MKRLTEAELDRWSEHTAWGNRIRAYGERRAREIAASTPEPEAIPGAPSTPRPKRRSPGASVRRQRAMGAR